MNSLQVYPNPANLFFSLDLQDMVNPAEWSVTLYDLQGKSVYINPADLQQHHDKSSASWYLHPEARPEGDLQSQPETIDRSINGRTF